MPDSKLPDFDWIGLAQTVLDGIVITQTATVSKTSEQLQAIMEHAGLKPDPVTLAGMYALATTLTAMQLKRAAESGHMRIVSVIDARAIIQSLQFPSANKRTVN